MGTTDPSDDELVASGSPADFELFYCRHVEELLGFFARRTRDPELAADLTAETFAAALAGQRRFRPQSGAAAAWLYGIAMHKLRDALRRGYAERRARRRMGMERLELYEDDYARIEALGEATTATALLELLTPAQRDAVHQHVVEERGYAEIARAAETSETVVRKRVSRGLAVVRKRMGTRK
jgi:RNA polymerase sigma factor (sigma-70 family)